MSEEVEVKKDEATGDTIMKKPVRYKRAEPTMQELAAEEELKAREGSTEETTEEATEEPANAEEASFKKRYGDLRRHAQKVADEKAIPLCEGHHQGNWDQSKIAIHKDPKLWRETYGPDYSYSRRTEPT